MSTPVAPDSDWRVKMQPVLDSLEAERKNALNTVTIAGAIIGGITLVVMLYLLASNSFFTPLLVLLPAVLGGAIFAFVYSNATSTYRDGFKRLVLPQLINVCAMQANGVLEYSSSNGISESEFRSSGLFRAPDIYSSEDLLVGKLGETAVRFSEVHAQYRQTTSNGKTTTTTYHTIFKGLFFIADFNKHFHGTTLVLPDTAENLFGRFGQTLQHLGAQLSFSGRELVRLEDPEFERTFVVYSTDQIEARYILTPSLMQRLLQFRTRCKTQLHMKFEEGRLIIAIPLDAHWLEPPTLSTPLTSESLNFCLDQLRFACGIVDDLDLNTRIWSK